jgi:hypothetical protein
VSAGLFVLVAGAALVSVMRAPSPGAAASAAYYGYCPDGSAAAVYYGYCPPPNEPPDCSTVTASPSTLWPPNHTFRLVTLTGATDPDGDEVTLTITGVTQDEPVNGIGDGNTSPDAQPGPSSNTVFVRAERSGRGDGRVYRISFTGADAAGGTCSGTVTVGVPHDRGKGSTPIDSAPPSYDSFGP